MKNNSCKFKMVFILTLGIFLVSGIFVTYGVQGSEVYNLDEYNQIEDQQITKFEEAPVLKEKVDKGELPSVKERLPENPLVISPWDNTGKYGGTWNRLGIAEDWAHFRMSLYGFSLIRWIDDGLDKAPNLLEKIESNNDDTIYTLHLREGIKWSDGEPLTVDDIIFWWEEMALNGEHSEPVPTWAKPSDTPMNITKIDDYKMTWEFVEPNPLLIDYLAMWADGGLGRYLVVPKHYLEQFHPDLNDEYDNFEEFEEKQEWWLNPDCPVLTAWKPVEIEDGQYSEWERNPYYYAVDTEGNQLPYIDKVYIEFVSDNEVYKLKVVNGDSDMQLRPNIFSLQDISLLKQKEEETGFETLLWNSGQGVDSVFVTNQNHPDSDKRKLFRNPNFLRALSHAIDRPKIQKMIYYNQGELTTGTYSPNASEYHTEKGEKMFEQWRDLAVSFDLEKSKELLNDINVIDQDGDGWRDLPNGEELTLRIDLDSEAPDVYTDTSELVKETWEEIGIETIINPVDGSKLSVMVQNGEFDIRDSWGVGDGPNHLVFANWLVPLGPNRWAPLYGAYHQGVGQEPQEKPESGSPYDRLYQLYKQAIQSPSEEERNELVYQMIQIHIDHGPFFFGVVSNVPRVGIVKNNFKNVPFREDLKLGGFAGPWIMVYPGIINPEQFYMEQ